MRFAGLLNRWGIFVVAVLALAAGLDNEYYFTLLNFIGIHTLLVVGLNLLLGYAGQISLGHAAFFGLGAYASGILTATYGVNPWLALLAAWSIDWALAHHDASELAALPPLDPDNFFQLGIRDELSLDEHFPELADHWLPPDGVRRWYHLPGAFPPAASILRQAPSLQAARCMLSPCPSQEPSPSACCWPGS